jgi:PPM family protein phosphatase
MIPLERSSATLSVAGRRPSNQDAAIDVRLGDDLHLIAVADGMGGHQSGEVASAMAVEVLRREIAGGRSLRAAATAANAAIHESAARNPLQAGMGTTLVALLRRRSTYEIANVGDSRAYRIERSGIRRITQDHSFAAEAARTKVMSSEEIARSPWRNALTRSLGTENHVEVDVFGPFPLDDGPHVVLLCSDGIYRSVTDEGIRQLVLSFDDVGVAAEVLTTRALQNGSDDNMSVALVEFGKVLSGPRTRRIETARPNHGGGATEVAPRASTGFPRRRSSPVGLGAATLGGLPVASVASRPPARRSRFSRWLDRVLGLVANDNTLFGISVAILLVWLLSHLGGGS